MGYRGDHSLYSRNTTTNINFNAQNLHGCIDVCVLVRFLYMCVRQLQRQHYKPHIYLLLPPNLCLSPFDIRLHICIHCGQMFGWYPCPCMCDGICIKTNWSCIWEIVKLPWMCIFDEFDQTSYHCISFVQWPTSHQSNMHSKVYGMCVCVYVCGYIICA